MLYQLSYKDQELGAGQIVEFSLTRWKEWNIAEYKLKWRYDRPICNSNLSKVKVYPKKTRGFNKIRTHGICVSSVVCTTKWATKTHILRANSVDQFLCMNVPWTSRMLLLHNSYETCRRMLSFCLPYGKVWSNIITFLLHPSIHILP